MHKRQQPGFSLIELMVVVAIVAIIASIAFPSYENSMRKSRRATAQSHLMDLAQREQQYFLDNRGYATRAQLIIPDPATVADFYTVTVTLDNAASPPTFTVTATPIAGGKQVRDGALTINYAGTKTPADKW